MDIDQQKNFKKKYLKYKSKYLNLKKKGGYIDYEVKKILDGSKPYNFENFDFKNSTYTFSNKDLTGANFKGIKNTKYLRFRGETVLDNANFEGAEMPAEFRIKSAKNINLSNVDFKDKVYSFYNQDFTGANFKGIKNTKYLNFRGETVLDNANFEGAEMPAEFKIKSAKNINLSNVDFKDKVYSFYNKDFTGANFKGIKNTKYLNFRGETVLDNANFEDAEIPGELRMKSGKNINFKGADFKNRVYRFSRSFNLTANNFLNAKNTSNVYY